MQSYKKQTKIKITILTRDRLNYFKEALDSVIKQETQYRYLISVSDNSEGNETELYIKNNFPSISYTRRLPTLQSIEHFKKVISENLEQEEYQYFVLFHDDDVMSKDYIEEMNKNILKNKGFSAIGCNSKIIKKNLQTEKMLFKSQHNVIRIDSIQSLIKKYFSVKSDGIAPFPSYLYDKSKIKIEFLNKLEGGKYRDFTLLVNLLKSGHLIWINKPLINYRIHGANDSSLENIPDRLRLNRFFLKNRYILKNSNSFNELRVLYWARYIIHNKIINSKLSVNNQLIIIKYFIFNGLLAKLIIHRLINKWF